MNKYLSSPFLTSEKIATVKMQFLPVATATVATVVTLEQKTGFEDDKKLSSVTKVTSVTVTDSENQKKTLTSQNSNFGFLTELNKISYLTPLNLCERDYLVTKPKTRPSDVKKSHLTNNSKVYVRVNSKSADSSQLAKINQLSFFEGFNCLDLVAVTGNNARQELRKLLTTVQYHHTLVDVFLCLSFANCLFTGELRLALALVCLWWGGDGNKPFIRQIPSAVLLRFSNLPTALIFLGLITQTSLPFEKV